MNKTGVGTDVSYSTWHPTRTVRSRKVEIILRCADLTRREGRYSVAVVELNLLNLKRAGSNSNGFND